MTAADHDPWAEAEAAIDALREALRPIGVTLADLGLDVPALIAGYPLVRLGSAPADVIRKIAAALTSKPA